MKGGDIFRCFNCFEFILGIIRLLDRMLSGLTFFVVNFVITNIPYNKEKSHEINKTIHSCPVYWARSDIYISH